MSKAFKGQYRDEKLLLKSHEHWVSFVVDKTHVLGLCLAIGGIIGLVLLFWLSNMFFLILSVIIALIIFIMYIRYLYSNTWIIVTSRRLLKLTQNTLFSKRRMELKLEDIKATEIHQNFWGMVFRYGELTIKGTEEASNIYFKGIPEYDSIANYIGRIIDYIKINGHTDNIAIYKNKSERSKK